MREAGADASGTLQGITRRRPGPLRRATHPCTATPPPARLPGDATHTTTPAVAYVILEHAIVSCNGRDSAVARAIRSERKGHASIAVSDRANRRSGTNQMTAMATYTPYEIHMVTQARPIPTRYRRRVAHSFLSRRPRWRAHRIQPRLREQQHMRGSWLLPSPPSTRDQGHHVDDLRSSPALGPYNAHSGAARAATLATRSGAHIRGAAHGPHVEAG